jgi:hypothetical protein
VEAGQDPCRRGGGGVGVAEGGEAANVGEERVQRGLEELPSCVVGFGVATAVASGRDGARRQRAGFGLQSPERRTAYASLGFNLGTGDGAGERESGGVGLVAQYPAPAFTAPVMGARRSSRRRPNAGGCLGGAAQEGPLIDQPIDELAG